MLIPFDVIKEISFYLPYNHLAISKHLINMYDECWFKNKLLRSHPNCKKNSYSWENLYKRSFKSGKVIKKYADNKPDINILVECIKIAEITENSYMILTFDNDLYSCFYQNNLLITELIDSDITDINYNSYIKHNQWYLVTDEVMLDDSYHLKRKLIVNADEKFIDVCYFDDYVFAITKNKLYRYTLYDPNDDGELDIIESINNLHMVPSNGLMIQHEDNSISRYEPYENVFVQCEISNVKEIYPAVIKLFDNTLINIDSNFDDGNNKLILTVISSECHKLQASIEYYGESILLINGNVFKFNTTSSEINPDYGLSENIISTLTLIHKNVKNICGWCNTHYYIV